jgi:hypothetical protein
VYCAISAPKEHFLSTARAHHLSMHRIQYLHSARFFDLLRHAAINGDQRPKLLVIQYSYDLTSYCNVIECV